MSAVTVVDEPAMRAQVNRRLRDYLRPREPERLLVHLTRVQVHRIFPRAADRFPLELRSGDHAVDLRQRLEVWPLALKDGEP